MMSYDKLARRSCEMLWYVMMKYDKCLWQSWRFDEADELRKKSKENENHDQQW